MQRHRVERDVLTQPVARRGFQRPPRRFSLTLKSMTLFAMVAAFLLHGIGWFFDLLAGSHRWLQGSVHSLDYGC